MSGGCEAGRRIRVEGYDPADQGRRETVFATGNGYWVVRAADFAARGDRVHYPACYRAGLYNRLEDVIQGEQLDNESLVRLPDWLWLSWRIDGGPWYHPDQVELLDYCQELELEAGVMSRRFRVRDSRGRTTALTERRLVSQARPHLAALELTLTPEDWSGTLELYSGIDARVVNDNVSRYAPYAKRHLEVLERDGLAEGVWLRVRTVQSRIEIALAARTRLSADDDPARPAADWQLEREPERVRRHCTVAATRGQPLRLEKVAALYTGRDPALSEAGEAARAAVQEAPAFATLAAEQGRAWRGLWERCDLDCRQPDQARTLALHAFHVLQTASPHSADLDVGIPSRGWHGEAYRGQIFWDELYVFPFLNLRFPSVARALLMYRYRRLEAARQMARRAGLQGAMFPWRSAACGREETPHWQLNPLSGHWMRDHTHHQRHIGSAIVYNVWHYYNATGDHEFLCDYGAELILEIARFWASRADYDRASGRYHLRRVIGPDEYQNAYPGATEPGIDDNAYTNLMAVWSLNRALEVLQRLPPRRGGELRRTLDLTDEELEHWHQVSRRMTVPCHGQGIISQFAGCEKLRWLDLQAFRARHGDRRIDWVLEAQGDSADNYQITKQADVLVLFHLLGEDEVTGLLHQLGYPFDHDRYCRTARYYLDRSSHESSLSRVVYAGALAGVDLAASWRYFKESLATDLHGLKGGSATEGIHLGAMAGSIDVLQRHYLGLGIDGGILQLAPNFPHQLGRVRMGVLYRRQELTVEAGDGRLVLRSSGRNVGRVALRVRGEARELAPGQSLELEL